MVPCKNCYAENSDDAVYCARCGTALHQTPAPPPPINPQQSVTHSAAKTSAMAVVSLVLGILGLFTCGITALVGFVLAIVSLVQIGHNRDKLTGQGIAIAGLSTSVVMLLCIPIFAAIIFPVFAKSREKGRMEACTNNQRQLATSAAIYAQENGGMFPSSLEQLTQTVSAKTLHCPTSSSTVLLSYGYNQAMSGKDTTGLTQPANIMLMADSDNPQHLIQSPQDIALRHSKGYIAAFVDGHVEYLSESTPIHLY